MSRQHDTFTQPRPDNRRDHTAHITKKRPTLGTPPGGPCPVVSGFVFFSLFARRGLNRRLPGATCDPACWADFPPPPESVARPASQISRRSHVQTCLDKSQKSSRVVMKNAQMMAAPAKMDASTQTRARSPCTRTLAFFRPGALPTGSRLHLHGATAREDTCFRDAGRPHLMAVCCAGLGSDSWKLPARFGVEPQTSRPAICRPHTMCAPPASAPSPHPVRGSVYLRPSHLCAAYHSTEMLA